MFINVKELALKDHGRVIEDIMNSLNFMKN
jgi:hypothetical protein